MLEQPARDADDRPADGEREIGLGFGCFKLNGVGLGLREDDLLLKVFEIERRESRFPRDRKVCGGEAGSAREESDSGQGIGTW